MRFDVGLNSWFLNEYINCFLLFFVVNFRKNMHIAWWLKANIKYKNTLYVLTCHEINMCLYVFPIMDRCTWVNIFNELKMIWRTFQCVKKFIDSKLFQVTDYNSYIQIKILIPSDHKIADVSGENEIQANN